MPKMTEVTIRDAVALSFLSRHPELPKKEWDRIVGSLTPEGLSVAKRLERKEPVKVKRRKEPTKKLYRDNGLTTDQLAAFFAKFPKGTKLLTPGHPGYSTESAWTLLHRVEEMQGDFVPETVVGPFGSVGKEKFFTSDGNKTFVRIGDLR